MSTLNNSRSVFLCLALLAATVGSTDLAAQTKKGASVGKNDGVANSVVLEVGNEKFTVQQIADAFKKNANRGGKTFYELPRDSAMQFLNLYADYRLKVHAAVDAGVDARPDVVKELHEQRMQLVAAPAPNTGYLIERKVVDPAVESIFKRRADEVKIAVIYTKMNISNPADTIRAYQRSYDMLDRLKAGADFGQMAVDSTDDPSTKAKRGDLGWITGGMILRAMEDAAYDTKPGNVYPDIIRAPSGYVLLKVLDRSPRYTVHAAHILIEAPPGSDIDTNEARKKAENALARIRAGEDFAKVAREVSEDKVSGENGGDLVSYYTRSLGFEAKQGKLEPEFEEALYALKDGEISGVVRTSIGYHIIKRIDSHKPTFEEEKDKIRNVYKQYYLPEDRQTYVSSIIRNQGFKVDETTMNQVLGAVDQKRTTADTLWAAGINEGLRKRNLFTFHGRSVTVGDWIDSIETRRELRVTPLNEQGIRSTFEFLLEPEALVEESKSLEKEYPDFAALMQEFHDGLLIIRLEEEKIWNKVKYDDEKGQEYFQQHRDNYMTQPMLALTEIQLFKEDEVKKIYAEALAGTTPFDSLAARYTQRRNFREKAGHWELSTAKNKDIVRKVLEQKPDVKAGEILAPFTYQSGWSIIRVDTVQAPRRMTYEEAKSEVTGDYMDYRQEQLKDEWISELRKKTSVKINERALDKALASK